MKKITMILFMITFALISANVHAAAPGTLGTDNPCKYIDDDSDNDIFCYSTGKVSQGEIQYFLINVDQDRKLNISGSTVSEGDTVRISSLINPLGKKETCAGTLSANSGILCSISHPTKGIWLIEISGTTIPEDGEYSIGANYDIYRPEKYNKDTGILQDNIKFYKTYIATGSRQEHLGVSAYWDDPFANIEMTIISPDVQTKTQGSVGDADHVRTYFPNPGATAEGTWITQLHALDARANLNFKSNYDFEYIESQEIIDGIVEESEIKEYPIFIEDSTTPLALTVIRQQAGDTLKIYSIFDPKGTQRTFKTYTDGCAIKDPEPGIWLVNVQGQSVVGQAPFQLASTHSTYVPDDHKATEDISDRGSVFYSTDIYTENKTHLVAVSSWDSYEPNMEITIISTNIKSAYDQSESDEKVAQKAYLTPGDTAEGTWVVQVKSIWKEATVTTNSNYNLTRIPTQSQIHGDLAQDETKVYYLEVTDSNTPLVITLTSFQSGDEFQITKIKKPDEKSGTCTKIQSGKETYTCAIQDPPTGVWVIEVKGKTVIGEGPFNLASTFKLTSCGNGVCDADENCDVCTKDCACDGTKICHRQQCLDPPKTVGEKKTWIIEEYEDGLIAEENYNQSIAQLTGYEDSLLLTEIGTTTQSNTENTGNDLPGASSGTLEIIIIIILALIPPAYLAYKKSKGNLTSSSSYSKMSLDFDSMTFFEKAKLIITKPKEFFEKMPTEGSLKEPVVFFLTVSIIITAAFVIGITFLFSSLNITQEMDKILESIPGLSLNMIIITIAISGIISGLIGLFITSAILKISFMLLKGKGSFRSIISVMAHLSALNLLIIPLFIINAISIFISPMLIILTFILGIVYALYTIDIAIIGYKKTQELDTLKVLGGLILAAVLSGLMPGIIAIILSIIL